MISVVYNETQKAIEIFMDSKGADLLIKTLQELKSDKNEMDHRHLYASNDDRGVHTKSPYPTPIVYGELILDILPSEAWDDL